MPSSSSSTAIAFPAASANAIRSGDSEIAAVPSGVAIRSAPSSSDTVASTGGGSPPASAGLS